MEGYQSYECTKCGGTLEFSENGLRAKCKHCGTDYFFKENKSQALVFALNRARGYLQNNDFDRAINEYETISKEYPKDAEAAWGLAISKYGIVYTKDDKTGKMVPTCSRVMKESILDSAPYKRAIKYCADEQRSIYEKEARKIDRIQKDILDAMEDEEDFDVFISFKAEDENGNATEDSVIARRIYDELTSRGIKTFFSAVTLDGRVGDEYEPIIYRALFSCKHFILVTTNEAYIEAPWVKNEWTRFRDRAEAEKLSGVCTAVYKNMKPYALPQIFQSQGVSLEKHFADYHLLLADNIERKLGLKKEDGTPIVVSGSRSKKPVIIATVAAFLVAAITVGTLFLTGVIGGEHTHTMSEWFVDSEPTCKTEGERHIECTECGAVIERKVIEKLSHTPGEWIIDTEANCRDEGAKHKECTACGTNVENAKIEKTDDHTVVIDPAVEPTDKEDGLTEGKHCSFCGEILVAQTVISANLSGVQIKTDKFVIGEDDEGNPTLSCSVSNTSKSFSFFNYITVAQGANYIVSRDSAGENEIKSKTVNLEIGDNVFYLYVENENSGEGKLYTVTIRRLPTYTVSFNTNGGSAVENKTIEEGSYASDPVPTLPGYSYTWDYDFSKPITGNITINATWTANTDTPYKVEYYLQNLEDNGYTVLDSETENLVGTTDTTASAEIKTFEHFTYNESASTVSGNINGDGSLVLKVCYTRNTYTVSTDVNNYKGGSVTNSGTYKYNKNVTVTATTNPGYTFLGWFEGENKVNENATFSIFVDRNVTYTAKWEANTDIPYKVEYYLENLEDDGYTVLDSETENFVGTTDTNVNAEIKTFEHFTYNESASTASGNINGDGSLVLKVCYTRNTYTVYTDVNNSKGGSVIGAGTNKYNKNVTVTATTNPGYTFLGWFEGEDKVNENTTFSIFADRNVTYTAKWEANTDIPYKVEYYLENLEDDGYTVLDSETENFVGTTDTNANAEIKTFEHFTYNESASTASGNINGDGSQVLKVYYSRDTYTVSLDKNVATAGNVSGGGTYKYGKEISLTMTATTNQGYTFLGWTLGGTTVSEEETYTVFFTVTENVSYIANWEVSNNIPYKVEYYFENVEDDGYTILDSETENLVGTTDTTANAQIKTFEHFTYNESASIVSGNIDADGSRVLKVYYTRNTYTVSSNEEILGAGTYKYGTEVTATVKARLGYNVAWNSGEEHLSTESTYTFIIENDVVAIVSLKDEMKSFNFTSDYTTCEITALEDETLTEVIIPDYVTSIGSWAFTSFDNLTSVTIGSRVTSIGSHAFENCDSLTSVTIGNSVTSIGVSAFENCASLKSVTIPDRVTTIDTSAFEYCTNLTSVTIGSRVTSIGRYAFLGCDSLTSVTIGNSVTSIGSGAFWNCTSLTSVKFVIPNGWSAGGTSLSSTDLSNTSTAAKYLRDSYDDCAWTRKFIV